MYKNWPLISAQNWENWEVPLLSYNNNKKFKSHNLQIHYFSQAQWIVEVAGQPTHEQLFIWFGTPYNSIRRMQAQYL